METTESMNPLQSGKKWVFDSTYFAVGDFCRTLNPTEEEIKNEPMLFNCDGMFAMQNGGAITATFLVQLIKQGINPRDIIFDSRVHMLMPGWYPCIPGWHHDDVPRTRSDGQPNYNEPSKVVHYMGLLNGEVAPTEFIIGETKLSDVPIGEKVYKTWNQEIEKMVRKRSVLDVKLASKIIYRFDDRAMHRGTAAVKSGWRWFGRASLNSPRKSSNEIRKQVQVYMDSINEGW